MNYLTSKQKKFCYNYLKTLNAKESAIKAGYSVRNSSVTASQLLKNPKIIKFMKDKLEKIDEKNIIEVNNILEDIIETREICKNNMLKKDSNGNIVISNSSINGRNKCNELLGKYKKMFNEKIDINVKEMPNIIIKK